MTHASLWLHSFILCWFWFHWNWHDACLQICIMGFSAISWICFPVTLVGVLQPSSHQWCDWRVCPGCRRPQSLLPLYALGLDDDLYMDKQIWIEHYPHKLLQDWIRIEWEYCWLFCICHVSSVIANIIMVSSVTMWWNLNPDFCIIVCPNFGQNFG